MGVYFAEMSSPQNRHSDLTGELFYYLRNNFGNNFEIKPFIKQENMGLIYRRSLEDNHKAELLNIKLSDAKDRDYLDSLPSYIPDIMLFDKHKYILSRDETKVAGYPDLIIEVWSNSNKPPERKLKQALYETSPITEHWYIFQHKNTVAKYLGTAKLKSQTLKEILVTHSGLALDLRHMSL
ncbi:MAG: Uma2 family endonuclease [Defluviitaleaceae bacterium]|nr:Uma2 family endonuclease [Defluviitaleaceae bacterium]